MDSTVELERAVQQMRTLLPDLHRVVNKLTTPPPPKPKRLSWIQRWRLRFMLNLSH